MKLQRFVRGLERHVHLHTGAPHGLDSPLDQVPGTARMSVPMPQKRRFRTRAFRTRIRSMALLVQREVAGRITAEPGRRAYGYLSVLAQIYSQPRVVLAVPPGAFSPPPKVHSALVSFAMQTKFPEWPTEDYERFLEFVKRCFAQKRKSLRNNLARTHGRRRIEEELSRLDLSPDVRAEQLTIQQLAYLCCGFSERGT